MPRFTEDDEGKPVVNFAGNELGIVTVVEDGVAYVEPDPGLTDRIKASLGWRDDPGMDVQPLEDEHIEEVTDERVVLRQDLHVDRTGTR